jgi:hypothetical protein
MPPKQQGRKDMHCDAHRGPMRDKAHLPNPFVANRFGFRDYLWIRQIYELPGSSLELDSAVARRPGSTLAEADVSRGRVAEPIRGCDA